MTQSIKMTSRGLTARLHLDPAEVRSAARAQLLGPLLRDRFTEPQRPIAELRDGRRSPIDPFDALAWLETHRDHAGG